MQTLQWLARRRLIKNTCICQVCHQSCKLTKNSQIRDGYQWHCRQDRWTQSIRTGSFFAESHMSPKQIMIVTYCWANNLLQWQAANEADVYRTTVSDWYERCRDNCEAWLQAHPTVLGGRDANGGRKIVEIDESLFFKRKYQVGRWRGNHWVFGGIERLTGECFLVEVADRTRQTLEAEIRQYIRPGSLIISDGWAAYAQIAQMPNMDYEHRVIVHQQNFVDPNDPEVHTQNIENCWGRVKRKLRNQYGTNDVDFISHLHEFMFRNKHRCQRRNMFSAFVAALSEVFGI